MNESAIIALIDVCVVFAVASLLGCICCLAICFKVYSEFVKEAKYREPPKSKAGRANE